MPERERGPRRQRRAGRPPGNNALYGAVDLGTNNCRLLIAEARPGGFRPVDSHSQAVRLGAGLARDGRITDEAGARAFDALRAIREKLRQKGVGQVKCVATQACRAAANGREFVQRVQKEVGLSFKIITPREEARLSVIGCHNLFDPDAEIALVIDIGGGSTELSWVNLRPLRKDGLKSMLAHVPLIDWATFPIGVVTLTEQCHAVDEPARYAAMHQVARDHLAGFAQAGALREQMMRVPCHMVGTSGTVTSLAAVHMGLDRYARSAVDGQWLTSGDTLDVTRQLAGMSLDERRAVPCIGGDRSELIVAGCAILDAIFEAWPADRIRVADRGLREGVLLSMIHGPKKGGGRRRRRRKSAGVAVENAGDSDE